MAVKITTGAVKAVKIITKEFAVVEKPNNAKVMEVLTTPIPATKAFKINPTAKVWKKPESMITSWFINSHCSCGCRLSTDNEYVWCSGINCDWHETKAEFMKNMRIEKQHNADYMRRFR